MKGRMNKKKKEKRRRVFQVGQSSKDGKEG